MPAGSGANGDRCLVGLGFGWGGSGEAKRRVQQRQEESEEAARGRNFKCHACNQCMVSCGGEGSDCHYA